MRSSYLYSRCKELAGIARKIGLEFTDLSMYVIKMLFLQEFNVKRNKAETELVSMLRDKYRQY